MSNYKSIMVVLCSYYGQADPFFLMIIGPACSSTPDVCIYVEFRDKQVAMYINFYHNVFHAQDHFT